MTDFDPNKYINNEDNDSNSDDTIIPEDEDIDERLRALDEVTFSLKSEELLCSSTFKSVQNHSKLAKEGKIPRKDRSKGRS